MIRKPFIYYTILLFVTFTGMWIISSFVRMATDSPDSYPFVYYSAVMKDWGIIDYKDKEMPLSDLQGNKYTTAQFDSLMPFLNYRQLMADGRLPDSICGTAISPPLLRAATVVFRYAPRERKTLDKGLYILFESMPKRVGLEMPDDVFRLKDGIEFIDVQTNTVNREKSDLFARVLEKAGYTFPARWAIGNPNPRKPYDEGYFTLDSQGRLYHLKMVNNRPFVKDTRIDKDMDMVWFSMYEASNKRFYGFLFDPQGGLYILESREGQYVPVKLDIPPIDIDCDEVTVMGNLLYWTVIITTPQGRRYYGLETETLKRVSEHAIAREPNRWDKVSGWLFPFYITFQESDSHFLYPRLHVTEYRAWAINLLLALLVTVIASRRSDKLFAALFVALTGIAGIVAWLLMPKNR